MKLSLEDVTLDLAIASARGPLQELPDAPLVIAAAHPTDPLGPPAAALLAEAAQAVVVTWASRVSRSPRQAPLHDEDASVASQMVDELEATRHALGVAQWVFWGMSGGGWLGQLYARLHPGSLRGLILESTCACFAARLADPTCLMSPRNPHWRAALEAQQANLPPRASSSTGLVWTSCSKVGGATGTLEVLYEGAAPRLVSPMPLSEAMRTLLPTFLSFDARPWLPSLQVPTLVIAGTDDGVAPLAHVRALHDAIPGSRWLALAAGHVPTAQKAPGLAETVRGFLAALRGSGPPQRT